MQAGTGKKRKAVSTGAGKGESDANSQKKQRSTRSVPRQLLSLSESAMLREKPSSTRRFRSRASESIPGAGPN
jgi:hypothetical protein